MGLGSIGEQKKDIRGINGFFGGENILIRSQD